MEKIMATFDGVLAGVTKFSNNKYIKSISDAMMALIGIMIFWFICSYFSCIPNTKCCGIFCHYRT